MNALENISDFNKKLSNIESVEDMKCCFNIISQFKRKYIFDRINKKAKIVLLDKNGIESDFMVLSNKGNELFFFMVDLKETSENKKKELFSLCYIFSISDINTELLKEKIKKMIEK